jgi:hypothetical protein
MEDNKHKGWTNFGTWKVYADILSDIEFDEYVDALMLQELVDDVVFSQFNMKDGSHFVEEFAKAFISEVNYYEIADNINDEIDTNRKYNNNRADETRSLIDNITE